jgi:hypothetical protein
MAGRYIEGKDMIYESIYTMVKWYLKEVFFNLLSWTSILGLVDNPSIHTIFDQTRDGFEKLNTRSSTAGEKNGWLPCILLPEARASFFPAVLVWMRNGVVY